MLRRPLGVVLGLGLLLVGPQRLLAGALHLQLGGPHRVELSEQLPGLGGELVLGEHLVAGGHDLRDGHEVAVAAGELIMTRAHTKPKKAPKTMVSSTRTVAKPSWANIAKISPTKAPSQAPEIAPPKATLDLVSRPVTRSNCLRSVPTMRTFSTGNCWSER